MSCGLPPSAWDYASWPSIALDRLDPFARELAAITPEVRMRKYELRPDRADVILPAALIVAALAELFDLHTLVVPGTGLREGILLRLAGASHQVSAARHASRMRRVATVLFDRLGHLHQLWPPARALLESAVDGAGVVAPPEQAEPADRRAAEILTALVALAEELVSAGTRNGPTVDLTCDPVVIDAGLRGRRLCAGIHGLRLRPGRYEPVLGI